MSTALRAAVCRKLGLSATATQADVYRAALRKIGQFGTSGSETIIARSSDGWQSSETTSVSSAIAEADRYLESKGVKTTGSIYGNAGNGPRTIEVRSDRTSDGSSWGVGKGRRLAVWERSTGRWLRD